MTSLPFYLDQHAIVSITDLVLCLFLVLQAQIEDGHGTAERVSSSVRRLDDIQMKVQRALALVEDVINLRGCADVRRHGREKIV